ncbi:MAG: imidazoleglycerol-phosphate dehydratase HisB [Alkalispirochaetaceae bacterium]
MSITIERKTKETDIRLTLEEESSPDPVISIETPLPFFNHMLNSLLFHGGFPVGLEATGDVEVDPHHLVEDTGLVLGDALYELQERKGSVARFGHAVVPMDDALAEVTVDACRRSYLVYQVRFPQAYAGSFDLSLAREFFQAVVSRGRLNLHMEARYGENGHHMVEALFKATGRALKAAFAPRDGGVASTKGSL